MNGEPWVEKVGMENIGGDHSEAFTLASESITHF
jgi:hypothetical protein